MSVESATKDLVVLTADKNTQSAVRGILLRHQSLHIKELTVEYFVHPERDPGVYHNADEFLRSFQSTHRHALVFLDREGSGREQHTADSIAAVIEGRLERSGWGNRASSIVLDPEIEIWVWSSSPHVSKELGWTKQDQGLSEWLRKQGFLEESANKPARPKEAMEAVLRSVRKPRSSAIYESLAEKVKLDSCLDPSFLKLRTLLQKWFASN